MTREESLEVLCVAFGLDVRFDEHTFTFFIADAATNTVVAPPPMNIPTVEAWLDNYEKEEAEE